MDFSNYDHCELFYLLQMLLRFSDNYSNNHCCSYFRYKPSSWSHYIRDFLNRRYQSTSSREHSSRHLALELERKKESAIRYIVTSFSVFGINTMCKLQWIIRKISKKSKCHALAKGRKIMNQVAGSFWYLPCFGNKTDIIGYPCVYVICIHSARIIVQK